jgi:hypothetical protein
MVAAGDPIEDEARRLAAMRHRGRANERQGESDRSQSHVDLPRVRLEKALRPTLRRVAGRNSFL